MRIRVAICAFLVAGAAHAQYEVTVPPGLTAETAGRQAADTALSNTLLRVDGSNPFIGSTLPLDGGGINLGGLTPAITPTNPASVLSVGYSTSQGPHLEMYPTNSESAQGAFYLKGGYDDASGTTGRVVFLTGNVPRGFFDREVGLVTLSRNGTPTNNFALYFSSGADEGASLNQAGDVRFVRDINTNLVVEFYYGGAWTAAGSFLWPGYTP